MFQLILFHIVVELCCYMINLAVTNTFYVKIRACEKPASLRKQEIGF